MAVTFTHSHTAGEALASLEQDYQIKVPTPFTVEFGALYSPREEVAGFISLTANYTDITDSCRRKLKQQFSLEVPWWQRDSDSDSTGKDLEGTKDMLGWEVRVRLRGAYVCTIVGQKPKPAPQYKLDRAKLIKELTPDQKLFLMELEVANLEKPGVSYDVECKPA